MVLSVAAGNLGCATIMSGYTQDFQVSSAPPEAIVTVNEIKRTTPTVFVLDRSRESYTVTVEKPGYRAVTIELKRGYNGWLWGNILVGGIIGLWIDFFNGSAREFTPDKIHVDLINEIISQNHMEGQDILLVKIAPFKETE